MNGWPIVALGDVLTHRKQFIEIDDAQSYKRCRVQLHAQGVVLRDEVPGVEIKTKKQQVCRAGEFLVAEIDAKHGGFGLVPDALDGAIVSSHYFLFAVDAAWLDRRFLDYFCRTPAFAEQVAAQGSTNYAAIRPGHVLAYTIPLPPLAEQRRIVARVEALIERRALVQQLASEVAADAAAFVISTHIHLAGDRRLRVGDFLTLYEDAVPVEQTGEYPQVGLRGFGGGIFARGMLRGTETTYRAFNRLHEGQIVLSQVKGWEGAIAVCPPTLAGHFASPEYRTFRCVPGKALPGYMAALVLTPWFHAELKNATHGQGARRERVRPERFLQLEMPMPNIDQQATAAAMFAKLSLASKLRTAAAAELDALLPSILDRAFKGAL